MASSTRRRDPGLGWMLVSAMIALHFAVLPAFAHVHTAAWLDEDAIDQGVYVSVAHPRVIREPASFPLAVVISNLAAGDDVLVHEVRWTIGDSRTVISHKAARSLHDHREVFRRYRELDEKMTMAAGERDSMEMEHLTSLSRSLLERLAEDVFIDRCMVQEDLIPSGAGASLKCAVDVDLLQAGKRHTVRRELEIAINASLPTGIAAASRVQYNVATSSFHEATSEPIHVREPSQDAWFAGDQHLHTTYSLDALVLDGTTENVTDYSAAAELAGLDWIVITDHSNVHVSWEGEEYYTPQQFAAGSAQAAAYTAEYNFLALYGQEMGLGSYGFWDLPSHMLAYPFETDSTGYLENPSSGLVFGLADCEPEQVIIDRINDAGGLGFIAHPFDSGALAFAEWNFDNGAIGWAGMEIFSDTDGVFKGTDQSSLDKWHDLLNQIAAPQYGELADRPGFPNAFPVGLGNSDAHEPGLIGRTFTYANVSEVSRENVTMAFLEGSCVASNGPLVFGRLNGAGAGDVAVLHADENVFELTLQTTPEFGPVGDYGATVFVNGSQRAIIPPSGSSEYYMTILIDGLQLGEPDKFITIRADSEDGVYHAIANPIWLQFTCNGDLNGDGEIDVSDLLLLLADWGCGGGCSGDADGDGDTDTLDLLLLLGAWGSCDK